MGVKQKEKQKGIVEKKETTAFRIMLRGIYVMVAAALTCAAIFALLMKETISKEGTGRETYRYHYALIADDAESDFWNKVYAGAQEEAQKNQAYVEKVGENMAIAYSTEGLMRMAMNSAVDGIILYAEDSKSIIDLINQAVEKGFFVVTMRQDLDASNRQCFVGVSSYDLGQEYGKQILEILNADDEVSDVRILVDDNTNESRQTMFTMGIKDALAKKIEDNRMPDMQIQRIDTSDTFSAEEAIRDIFMNETNLPDVLICLNSIHTQCVYQAVVDFNHVGDVKIIGYYASDTILEAIEKQIIYSTIRVDAESIGKSSVGILNEYQETGYANSYVPVGMTVIGRSEAKKLLEEESKNESIGN